ncbi:unnamed protein product [Malus baccata var. baccata]
MINQTAEKATPVPGKRNILITSALPYVNNIPRLGTISGCKYNSQLFALSLLCRLRRYIVIYICGTDEYGTATETKAKDENCTPQQICDKYQEIHKQVYQWFDISFDKFGTTDQCDKCGKLLQPLRFHTSLQKNWTNLSMTSQLQDLKSRCITRDLKGGVPVPLEKFEDRFFYVWFDAPIGYISITSCYTPDWEKWWKNRENVELYQFMGKDNVPFHTVMFPCTLLGTGENWTLMKSISVTEYMMHKWKFPKSTGIRIFSNDVQETNIPSEVWRYYLLANRPEVSDTFFTWADLQVKPNAELLINLGNFINRVLRQGYGSIIPDASGAESHSLTKILAERIGIYVDQYIEAMKKVKLKQALKMAMSVSSEGNTYLQESKFWQLYKQDQASCSLVIKTSAGLIYLLACLLEPFMPSFSLKVLKQLNLPTENQFLLCDKDVERARKPWDITCLYYNCFRLLVSQKDEDVEFFRKKFSGSQAERVAKGEAEAKKMAEKLDETKN